MKKLKRIIFAFVATLLLASGMLYMSSEYRIVKESARLTAAHGGLCLSGDSIVSLYPYHGRKPFLENMKAVTDMGEACPLPVYLAVPPRKMDVAEIPEDIDGELFKDLFRLAEEECEKAGVTYIDLTEVLTDESLYFATDHHWTSKGAYLAYRSIISAMGGTPIDENVFERVTAHTKYRGSDYNKSGKSPDYTVFDTIELYYPDNYTELVATIVNYPYDSFENNIVIGGMYCMDSLNSWDPYTVYFKGNTPYVTVRNGEDRETLMIVRDSFASALAPFLAVHYDIVMIDPRFYPEKLSKVVEREKVSLVLILENMGSFTENTIKFAY